MMVLKENDVIEKIEFDSSSISDQWKKEFKQRLARKLEDKTSSRDRETEASASTSSSSASNAKS